MCCPLRQHCTVVLPSSLSCFPRFFSRKISSGFDCTGKSSPVRTQLGKVRLTTQDIKLFLARVSRCH
ncbi:hypothetical protein Y1Q_0005237 [Alligator mississippiensis]|uniref:Uncharacterized protein n=1 Tax=Alligator mississippiensis TaxID=8496 RepID=A0A151MT40_ALLMI|nr:hypothetical protein Y1Q_0005237 [Alligator mississippiensis]